jgi:Methane oxygenase PmoA
MNLKIETHGTQLHFLAEGAETAIYESADPLKPHFRRLRTAAGHSLVVCQPHDHVHHKGCFFGLATREFNFWEESASPSNPTPIGRQVSRALKIETITGPEVGFMQSLRWEGSDGTPVFDEMRRVRMRPITDGFAWTWHTRLTSLRDNEFAMSPWSMANARGVKVNYHGLAFRLRRDFSGMGGNTLLLDACATPFADVLGATPAAGVTYIGSIDEIHPVPRIALTLQQAQPDALFILENPFAWLSAGPSALASVPLPRGTTWEQSYQFTVVDAPSAA